MTKEEIRLQVAISCIQGILEAKLGIIGEIVPEIAVKESLRIADEFVKQWDKSEPEGISLCSWEDVRRLVKTADAVVEDWGSPMIIQSENDYYEEVLQRFKEQQK